MVYAGSGANFLNQGGGGIFIMDRVFSESRSFGKSSTSGVFFNDG
jgi:hypothetical protein